MYLIRKGDFYYRPNSAGYTAHADEAGRYSLEDAINITHPNGPDGPRDGMDYVVESKIVIGLGRWLEKVEVQEHNDQYPHGPMDDWYSVSDGNDTIAYFRNMDDAFTFKLDYINGKLNK